MDFLHLIAIYVCQKDSALSLKVWPKTSLSGHRLRGAAELLALLCKTNIANVISSSATLVHSFTHNVLIASCLGVI